MDQFYKLQALAAETLALQAILIGVLERLAQGSPELRTTIAAGFDDAANNVEHLAIKLGPAASPEHIVKALQIVEGLRAATLGQTDKPKGVV